MVSPNDHFNDYIDWEKYFCDFYNYNATLTFCANSNIIRYKKKLEVCKQWAQETNFNGGAYFK